MAFLWTILITDYKTCYESIKETSLRDVSFLHINHMFDREKLRKKIFRG